MTKMFILGLDCATPQLMFDKYLAKLPTISGLLKHSKFGLLESSIPPVTVPAWMSMMTGKDPGQLGFYGFTDREGHSYQVNKIITHSDVKAKTLWDYAGDTGLSSIVINLPQTYPPREINGIMVASFLTPDKLLNYTYPKDISEEIDDIAGGDYIIDVENFRTSDKSALLSQIYEMTEKRFEVLKNFIRTKDWDLFIAVEMGIDRLHHGFWAYCFEDHRLYDESNEFKNVILDYYKFIDTNLARLIDLFDNDTELMIVSDHGARTLRGTFCLNDWLIENGYLKLNKELKNQNQFDLNEVDWSNTVAWGSGGYYGKIYLNVKGRESKGIINEDQIEDVKNDLMTKLSSIKGPNDKLISNKIFNTTKIYKELNNSPPDLFILVGELDWRVTSTVGNNSLFLFENTKIDNANHDSNGILIYSKSPKLALEKSAEKGFKPGSIGKYSILDITPTVLNEFKIKIPEDLFGKIIN